jgi:predicted nucleic acid-binding protein
VVEDEADNRILECGLAGRVDAIVTGDKGLPKLASYEEMRVISVREFLDS